MNLIKGLVIVGIILLVYKFFYYRNYYNEKKAWLGLILGSLLMIYGIYEYFSVGDISFRNIQIVYYTFLIYHLILASFVLIALHIRKHKLSMKIDITLTFIKKVFGQPAIYVAIVLFIPAMFFIVIAIYKILGEEHIFFWIMVFISWTIGIFKVFKTQVLK